MIKKTKRQHQLWTDYQEIKKKGLGNQIPQLAGRWYYTYTNSQGESIGLAKLCNPIIFWTKKKWMWECCHLGKLELQRFPTQKAAEKAINDALEPKKLSYKSRKEK
jgi:hypothetical protein